MGKSEQFRYNPLEGERDQPQISVDAEALYDLLIRAETMVSKVDRIRYIHRAEDQILDVIAEGCAVICQTKLLLWYNIMPHVKL